MNVVVDIAPIILSIVALFGFFWQRYVWQQERADAEHKAEEARRERGIEQENQRTKLLREMEEQFLSNYKAQMDELRGRVRDLETENMRLRQQMREAVESRDRRIAELEARVAHLESENSALRGGK